jgi:Fumarylacetoacetate (FAA) hydrolase family/Rv2993c-like, N-terminal
MRLCMFHPIGHPMERGWVGRVDGDRVIQLAAQTLQSFFTGGGAAREHAEYPLDEVQLLAPILHPPSVRLFDEQDGCAFANPAAIVGPGAEIESAQEPLALVPRLAAVIGAEGALAAFTILAEWRDPARRPPKDRDFALGLGPVAVTPDELDRDTRPIVTRVDGAERAVGAFTGFDWQAAVSLAAEGTKLYPGDLIAGPGAAEVADLSPGPVEIDVDGIGVLAQRVR